MRSEATMSRRSPRSYISRTFPEARRGRSAASGMAWTVPAAPAIPRPRPATSPLDPRLRPVDELTAISPLDGRYRPPVEEPARYFSEAALIRYRVLVEVEWLLALAREPEVQGVPPLDAPPPRAPPEEVSQG